MLYDDKIMDEVIQLLKNANGEIIKGKKELEQAYLSLFHEIRDSVSPVFLEEGMDLVNLALKIVFLMDSKEQKMKRLKLDPLLGSKTFHSDAFLDRKFFSWGQFQTFNSELSGEYGSNQSEASLLFDKYIKGEELTAFEQQELEILLKEFKDFRYLPDMDENTIAFLLKNASNGGCGIANNANIIMDLYANLNNGETRFLEKYGFPMYYIDSKSQKHYNYNALFVKLYLNSIYEDLNFDYRDVLGISHGDRERIPGLDNLDVVLNTYVKGYGLLTNKVSSCLINELTEDFRVSTKIYGFNVSTKTYEENIDDFTYCTISAHNFKLNPYGSISIEKFGTSELSFPPGHFMTIMGISENGNFLVSSWGYSFELTGCMYGDLIFTKVEE